MRRLWLGVTVCCVGTVTVPSQASPLQLFGPGGRSPGLGAVGVAAGDDFDCVYLNPAGLADVRRKRFSTGVLIGSFDLHGVDRNASDALGVEIGASLPLPLGANWQDRVGVGIGLYIPTDVLNRARAPRPGVPFFALLENRADVLGAQIAVGVRVSRTIAVGAGVLALAALSGHIDVAPDAAGRFATTSQEQLISDFAPIFGVRWRPRDNLTVGATLRFESKSSYNILVTTNLGQSLPITLPELRVAGTAQYDPMILATEIAWRPKKLPNLMVAAQIAWERWSAFPLPTENPIETQPPLLPPGFHDTIVPRLGVEWTHHGGGVSFALRGGYFYTMSPAPDGADAHELLDNDRHTLTAGFGFALDNEDFPFRIDAWFQGHVLVPRDYPMMGTSGPLTTSGAILVGGVVMGLDL